MNFRAVARTLAILRSSPMHSIHPKRSVEKDISTDIFCNTYEMFHTWDKKIDLAGKIHITFHV